MPEILASPRFIALLIASLILAVCPLRIRRNFYWSWRSRGDDESAFAEIAR